MPKHITKIIVQLLVLIPLLFSLSGCGTRLARYEPDAGGYFDEALYPATQIDAVFIFGAVLGGAPASTRLALIPLCLLDMPFAVASDTLLLPYDISKKLKKNNQRKLASEARLAKLISGKGERALIVRNLTTGKELLSAGNAIEKPLIPASLVKLFITGAVLNRHSGLNMQTTLSYNGTIENGTLNGNLYLLGRGNALLTTDDLRKLALAIAEKGIHRINGEIIADDTYLDTNGLKRYYKGAGYAPAGALGLNLNTIAITVTPTEPNNPPRVTIDPPNDAVRIAITANRTGPQNTITQISDTEYRVTGYIGNEQRAKQRFPLEEPALYAVGTLKTILHESGIEVEGETKKGATPTDAKQLAEIDSPDLVELLGDMNKNSLNVVADNLLLLLGAETGVIPGTREKGINVVNQFLDTLGLPKGKATIADGSGLSAENRITAEYITSYLLKVAQKPWFSQFRNTLPRPGYDGTLKGIGFRYQDEPFRVKSGRLENAIALAGYGVDAKGKEIAFTYIINTPEGVVMGLESTATALISYLKAEVL